MKKAMSTLVGGILVAVILVGAIWVLYHQSSQIGAQIDKLSAKFFPKRTGQIVIPGTVVGPGCAPIIIHNADELAQAAIDCCNKGKCNDAVSSYTGCCAEVTLKNTVGITKNDLDSALAKNSGWKAGAGIAWRIAGSTFPIKEGFLPFMLCFTAPTWGANEVHLTYIYDDCK